MWLSHSLLFFLWQKLVLVGYAFVFQFYAGIHEIDVQHESYKGQEKMVTIICLYKNLVISLVMMSMALCP